MASFNYEWYTIEVKEPAGRVTIEVKAKSTGGAIQQIKRMAEYSNSAKNLTKPLIEQTARIIEIYWETMELDRIGYNRAF